MTPTRDEVAGYYDDFNKVLLEDYVRGNPRFFAAIDRVESRIDESVKTLLDIGCGAGVSSMYYKRRHPHLKVVGLDISPRNIEVARTLFGDSGVDYVVSNVIDGGVEGTFDTIAMVDVHEHVPRGDWPAFHQALNRLLSPKGTIVLTYPSEANQAYLQEHDPEGLQVIDESITILDMQALAERVGGLLAHFEYVDIWRVRDYVHAIVTRADALDRVYDYRLTWRSFPEKVVRRLRSFRRRRFVEKRLAKLQTLGVSRT